MDHEQLQSFDPATGELVGAVPVTPPERIAELVAVARAAAPAWAALGAPARADVLRGAGARIVARVEELGRLLSREMGKPTKEARGEVLSCGHLDDELAEMVEAFSPRQLADTRTVTDLLQEPYGVCAAITPWNFPISMPHWMCLPALMAGNAVVLKPSEETPLIAQAYVDALNAVLPPGVLQVVHGAEQQGKALVAADVDLIAFTGSRAAGAHILAAAAPTLKRVILELGGKDPMLVLEDADVQQAAKFAVRNSFRNAGQVCVSTERIYVDEAIADAFEAAVIELTGQLEVGPGLRDGVDVGPMISVRQRDHVLEQIDRAVVQGATVAAGGRGHHGNFVMPTVLTHVTHDMDVMSEETFGPVACIVRVDGDDEAVELANDTPYGLGASVWGGDVERATAVARRVNAGMVGVNRSCGGATGSPWVGAKQSGFGFHGGIDGHRQFSQTRIVSRPRP